jgi:hypothetical protein
VALGHCYGYRVALGDFYVPDPVLSCPTCGARLPEWDGFGGPGAFLVFQQGKPEAIEARLGSQAPDRPTRLPNGRIPIFATCPNQHYTMAEAIVEREVFARVEYLDVDGGEPVPLEGRFVLWRARGHRFSVSTRAPTLDEGVIPASITAIGSNPACILATRRENTRDPNSIDEWWVVDVKNAKVIGPIADERLQDELAARGLPEPGLMKLPEEIR